MADPAFTDVPLARRPALPAGARLANDSLTLEAVDGLTILQLLGRPGSTTADAIRASLDRPDADLRPSGPGQWFLVSASPLDAAAIAHALGAAVHVVDQSEGRAAIRLSGPAVRRVLASGTAVDLDVSAFPVGHGVMTQIGHIGASLACRAEDSFDLLVLRGFAESLWHDLAVMAGLADR